MSVPQHIDRDTDYGTHRDGDSDDPAADKGKIA
jgi:hypothetical protein